MNQHTLRKIAASASVVLEVFDGKADVLPLIKALYLADRDMLAQAGFTITGDTYVSMKNGPVLSGAYSLLRGDAKWPALQRQWNTAFSKNENTISMKGKVDRGALSPREDEILRKNATLVKRIWDSRASLSDWMHKQCPEWENPGKTSRKLPISKIAAQLPAWKGVDTSRLDAENAYAENLGSLSILAGKPLLLATP